MNRVKADFSSHPQTATSCPTTIRLTTLRFRGSLWWPESHQVHLHPTTKDTSYKAISKQLAQRTPKSLQESWARPEPTWVAAFGLFCCKEILGGLRRSLIAPFPGLPHCPDQNSCDQYWELSSTHTRTDLASSFPPHKGKPGTFQRQALHKTRASVTGMCTMFPVGLFGNPDALQWESSAVSTKRIKSWVRLTRWFWRVSRGNTTRLCVHCWQCFAHQIDSKFSWLIIAVPFALE